MTGTRVSAAFFRTLGVVPALGRHFQPDENAAAAPHAVMISYEAWQGRFGGRTNVLGEAVILNGIPRTIVGVLPREFHFAPAGRGEFWTTLRATDSCEQRRGCQNLNSVARLNPLTPVLEANRGLISGEPTHVLVAFSVGVALVLLFALWALGGLRRAEAAG